MYFMALALDYDGTLACEGSVSIETIDALIAIKASGRKLILVTGRQLDDLQHIFNQMDLFDIVIAENGALLYIPQTETQRLLAEPLPEQFLAKLNDYGIKPLRQGKVIISTEEPQEVKVLEVIRDMGLAMEIIFNKGSVMVLPSGINKATGLTAALKELSLSMHNVIGIGDAENDHPFLRVVGIGISVANATESLKQSTELVTEGSYGQGVEEVIDQLLKDEYEFVPKIRNKIVVGSYEEGSFALNPLDRVLIAGNSGIGKSTLATALTEKMTASSFQFCVFDPEGDYEKLENAINIGEVRLPPLQEQVFELLQNPEHNVVVNTLGVDLEDRPSFFVQLAPQLLKLKSGTGRPHWLIIDEAHHLIPAAQNHISVPLPKEGIILITVHPEEIAIDTLKALNIIITLGPQALVILEKVSQIIGEPLPSLSIKKTSESEVLIWQRLPISLIKIIKPDKPKQQHKRHTRKYAEGDLSDEFCFYFRGPNKVLNLKVQNLMLFLQISEGIDNDTWMYHLRQNDYSDWFRVHIKDDVLADAAAQVENDQSLSPIDSRNAIAELIKKRYTAPASAKNS